MKNVFFMLFAICSYGQSNIKSENEKGKDDFVDMPCPHYLFNDLEIKEFDKLDSVNPEIAKKAWEYLKDHVTKKNLHRIYFANGRKTTIIKKTLDPLGKETKYYLCFGFSDKQKGITNYGIYLELDSHGNLVNKIKLPNCIDDSKCLDLKKLSSIKKSKPYKKFFIKNQTKVELDVNFELNIFCWKFINEKYDSNGVFIIDELLFNAYNGEFLVRQQEKGEWVE